MIIEKYELYGNGDKDYIEIDLQKDFTGETQYYFNIYHNGVKISTASTTDKQKLMGSILMTSSNAYVKTFDILDTIFTNDN